MTVRSTPSTPDCTDTQIITTDTVAPTRPRGVHRAERKPLSRRALIARASALGVLGVLTVAAPVVGVSSDNADAASPKVAPVTTSALQSLDAGFAATTKDAPASDALAADRADRGRAELERASRVKVREALPEDGKAGAAPAAEAKPAPAPQPAPAPAPEPEPVAVAEPPRPEVVMPVAAGDFRLTSQYGARWGSQHLGVDFAAPLDTPIHSVADGEVTYVGGGKEGRSSMIISIRHNVGGKVFESWYVHMYPDDLKVSLGQQVQAGDVIAGVGNNGNSTGPHLHFEIHTPGGTTEPLAWMESLGAVDVGQR